jgi:hypothetical protein
MATNKISSTRKLIQEKFGYTTNLPNHNNRMHDDVTDKNGKEGKNPAYLPVEEFRKQIKLLMGATTTEEDERLKDVLDFRMLHRLFEKNGIQAKDDIDLLEKSYEKGDKNLISQAWLSVKDKLPFWIIGMLTANNGPGAAMAKDNDKLPENDKKALVNLFDVMEAVNKEAKKQGKDASKNTTHVTRDTQAATNLKQAKSSAKIEDKAPHDLNKKPENELGK